MICKFTWSVGFWPFWRYFSLTISFTLVLTVQQPLLISVHSSRRGEESHGSRMGTAIIGERDYAIYKVDVRISMTAAMVLRR